MILRQASTFPTTGYRGCHGVKMATSQKFFKVDICPCHTDVQKSLKFNTSMVFADLSLRV